MLSLVLSAAVSCKKEEKTTEDATVKTDSVATAPTHNEKIVSLNGAVTEIIAALGHEKEVVGRDITSTYPESIKATSTDLGHVSKLSVEAVIALQPTVIFATEKEMTPELLSKFKQSGIKTEVFKQDFTTAGTKKLIGEVAKVLNHGDYTALEDKIDADLKAVKPIATAPKVLFIYARGANMMMVSGTGTPVEKIIEMAGGKNAVTDFADFKPLTPEALVKGNPDVILLFDSGLVSLIGAQGVLKIPGVDKTNAGKNKKIIAMDGALLSGFGPRVGEGAAQLNTLLLENAK